jgi:hypothetical protein
MATASPLKPPIDVLEIPLEDLVLPRGVLRKLQDVGYRTLGQLWKLAPSGPDELTEALASIKGITAQKAGEASEAVWAMIAAREIAARQDGAEQAPAPAADGAPFDALLAEIMPPEWAQALDRAGMVTIQDARDAAAMAQTPLALELAKHPIGGRPCSQRLKT